VNKERKKSLEVAGNLLAFFAVGVTMLVIATLIVNRFKKPEIPDCSYSFGSYQNLVKKGQYIDLLKNAPSYASQGEIKPIYPITIKRKGEIACGYLYVRVRNNGHPLNEAYDSIYINPQDLGGHLLRSRSISIPNPIAQTTEILLPLNEIPFLPHVPYNPTASKFEVADWVKLLNVTNQIKFWIGLSTQDTTGMIDEVRIAYKCWNSKTGEETHDCKLSK